MQHVGYFVVDFIYCKIMACCICLTRILGPYWVITLWIDVSPGCISVFFSASFYFLSPFVLGRGFLAEKLCCIDVLLGLSAISFFMYVDYQGRDACI